MTNILEEIPDSGKRFELKKFYKKFQRVKSLNLKKLKNSKYCRFHCKPAVNFYNSGAKMSFKESEPEIQIMMTHCIHCLQAKGFMIKIRERNRSKREIREQMVSFIIFIFW